MTSLHLNNMRPAFLHPSPLPSPLRTLSKATSLTRSASLRPSTHSKSVTRTGKPSATNADPNATDTRPDVVLGYDSVPEIPHRISLPLTGTLPSYLGSSTLYRVGPGGYDITHADGKPYHIAHWFDGLSLLHAFRIDAEHNAVDYHCRFLTQSLERAAASVPRKKWSGLSFGSPDPCRSLFGKLLQLWTNRTPTLDPQTGEPFVPNVGVTVQTVPGKGLVARTDITASIKFDEETLEIERFINLSEEYGLNGELCAAHGYYDSDTDEFLNYACPLGAPGKAEYSVFRVLSNGKPDVFATLTNEPCFIHSFSVTRNYVILIFWPMFISTLPLLLDGTFESGLKFDATKPTRFAVIARDGRGLVADYESEAFFAFHTVNAYEDEEADSIVIDLSRYENDDILNDLRLEHLRSGAPLSPTTLSRYTLPNLSDAMSSYEQSGETRAKAEHTVIEGRGMELACVCPSKLRSKHRFVYGVSSDDPGAPFSRIAKVDVTDGSRITWGQGLRVAVGEPIFVADPEGTSEDEGCLLVVALDAERGKSRLVVLNARDLSEMGSAEVPQVVPHGFHGSHHPN